MRKDDPSEQAHAAIAANSADLLVYLQRRVDVCEDAADLLGETMLIAWRRVGKLPREPEQARMWLFVIARNSLLNYHRGRRRAVAVAASLRRELAACAPPEPGSGAAQDVRAAIARLPDDLAELVRLVHWEGFTLADAAQLINIPAATARGRYARARSLLQVELSAYSSTC
jgi:RNA polymerase sigma factor (sigma-70 family)